MILNNKLIQIVSIVGLGLLAGMAVVPSDLHQFLSKHYDPDIPIIQPNEAQALNAVVWLDTRERAEYQVSRINDALWVGYQDFSLERLASISKQQQVIVYCSLGIRSQEIAQTLRQQGYTKVANLYGGLFHWINLGLPVVDDQGVTEAVHPYNSFWGKWLKRGIKQYN